MRLVRLGAATAGTAAWQVEQAMAFHQQQIDQAIRAQRTADQIRTVTQTQNQILRSLDAGSAERNIDPATGRLLPMMKRQLIPGLTNQNALIGGGILVLVAVAVALRKRRR